MNSSIYDSEQYLFEIAQNFIRSRIIFTSLELKIFDLLLISTDGLKCCEIAKNLNLYLIENESRCLQDTLDCLTAMNFLERENENFKYKLTKFTRNYLLPNRKLLSNIDQDFYKDMPQFHEIILNNNTSKNSIYQLMLLRIKQFVDLTNYSNISIDSFDENTDAIILWRQDGLIKDKIKQAYDILPLNKKGLLVLILPNESDEVTLALNLFLNMTIKTKEQENSKEFYTKKFLKQIGFRSVEKIQSTDDLQLLLAHK